MFVFREQQWRRVQYDAASCQFEYSGIILRINRISTLSSSVFNLRERDTDICLLVRVMASANMFSCSHRRGNLNNKILLVHASNTHKNTKYYNILAYLLSPIVIYT